MFENLAGNVLSQVLSKYFTDESLSRNQVYQKTKLGVWSGVVTLNDLQVKTDVINKKLRQKGQPFELVHCSLRQVEIKIPWAKFSNPLSGNNSGGRGSSAKGDTSFTSTHSSSQDAVVVLVMDGVQVLFRTSFEFHDDDLRQEEINQRRKALSLSESYAKSDSSNVEEYYDQLEEVVGSRQSYADLLKLRIRSGLLQEVAKQVHLHIRDVHLRIEDKESDPENPFAFGVTMESMHLQHDNNVQGHSDPKINPPVGVVSKVAQMNHLAAYWNALEYGHELPPENSLLHETCAGDGKKLSWALSSCITRRGNVPSSPSRKTYTPNHTYMLLPVDGYLHALLSTTPKDLAARPAIDIAIQLDSVSTNLRDFQCVQLLKLYGERKNFMFVKKFRKYRPTDSVLQNARAWWKYAARVVGYELRGSMLRWSWVRFQNSYASRARYMDLYERKIRQGCSAAPMDGSAAATGGESFPKDLTKKEQQDIQDLEDGIVGELSTADIILYRALTNVRLGNATITRNGSSVNGGSGKASSWWKQTVVDATAGDTEARNELDRLLDYLDKIPNDKLVPESKHDSLNAISVVIQLEEVHFTMFSPLYITSEETQLKRLHEKFLDLHTSVTRIGGSLKGDYKRFDFEFSIMDFNATEIRQDKTHHVVAYQLRRDLTSIRDDDGRNEDGEKPPLFLFAYSKKPARNPEVDKEAQMFLSPIEIILSPQCQWLAHCGKFVKELTTVSSVQKFWSELSLARLNALTLGKLGFVAKAESAFSNHESIDVDFNLHCPVIRIGMGAHGDFVCDTGVLSIKTDKLAGISRTAIRTMSLFQEGESTGNDVVEAEQWQNGIDDVSLAGVVSINSRTAPRKSLRRFMFSSPISVDSALFTDHGNRSFLGSFNLDDALVPVASKEHGKNGLANPGLQDLFYDNYQIILRVGRIIFSGESEISEISPGFEIRSLLQKSVIPSDHTLCKLKVHSILGSVKILLNEDIVSHMLIGVNVWKSVLSTDMASGTCHANGHAPNSVVRVEDFFQSLSSRAEVETCSEDASSNALNEDEFFDANEGAESIGGENSGIWFEDNWIADAESVIDGESRSSFSGRRGRRRQPSVSDVSSVSDQSASRTRRGHVDNGYLNAENLARLEETGDDEDDSAADSRKGREEDSFHSTISAGGQEKLLKDLEDDIAQTTSVILKLSESLRQDSGHLYCSDNVRIHDHRKKRKETKLQLDRSKAELKSMQVLLSDLQALMADDPYPGSDDASIAATRRQQTRNIRTLLRAKKRQDADAAGLGTGHSLVRNLNRALFRGSMLVHKIQVSFQFDKSQVRNDGIGNDSAVNRFDFDVVANQMGMALFHHVKETKFYFSLDQITAKIENPQDSSSVPSSVVFSGGTTDTLLPAHLPHLIAHSMEDRFLRGAINVGKHRLSESTDELAKAYKLRVVVGDIEISPYHSCVSPLFDCISKLKGSIISPIAPADAILSEKSPNGHSSLKSPRMYDLAIRLASLRFSMCRLDRVSGAFALTESSVRFIKISSTVQERAQLDVRLSNVQLLDVINLEAGRGLELLGRRDPYNALLQVRLRCHLEPVEECSGWVTGEETTAAKTTVSAFERRVRNVHVGVRINPLVVVVSPDATLKLVESVQELRRTFLPLQQSKDVQKRPGIVPVEPIFDVPTRWRVDITSRRVNIKFSRESKDEWDMTDDLGARMVVALTLVMSIQESPIAKGILSMRIGITDVSLIRFADDWPILEPFSIVNEVMFPHGILARLSHGFDLAPMQVRSDSALGEIEAVMARYGWESMPTRRTDDTLTKLAWKVTPLKINVSAPIFHLFNDVIQAMKHVKVPLAGEKKIAGKNCPSSKSSKNRSRFNLQISLDNVEVQLLRETESKPMALANPLISFTLTDTAIDYSQDEQVTASVLIRDSALFDLSCGRGIRVVGEDPEARLEFPYFVRVKLYMHHGPQTVRLHINWGRIQCLLLPSFVRSLLDLKEGLRHLQGNDSNHEEAMQQGKKDFFCRFLHHPSDVNLMLSADAETFECILPSTDVIEYLKKGNRDPIGVVTFRWKASLVVAFALDSLCDSSMPWLTLNLDGVFTDDEDSSSFKDFSSKYLLRGPGKYDGVDDGCSHELVNAFTVRISHRLSCFQALRTNIAKMDLAAPSRAFVGVSRVCFKISQPVAGEQRITNPINFTLLYRVVGASMKRTTDPPSTSDYEVELAQLLQMRSNFIDVLLYIQSKSAGGFTDSYQVSIRPILDMVKTKEPRRAAEGNDCSDDAVGHVQLQRVAKLTDLLNRAPTVCSLQIEGFQVTCVPGGASRLNESPIIKFELANVVSGVAATPVPQDVHVLPGSGAQGGVISPSRKYISGSELMNMTLVGWMGCKVTGHYHNRRLVAWEPFIEPWMANVRLGIDLVDVMKWKPVVKHEATISRNAANHAMPELDTQDTSLPVSGKERLRDFGRLFRSPFQQNTLSPDLPRKGMTLLSHTDLCFLMLSSSARNTMTSALCPTGDSSPAVESILFSTMPAHSPLDWLRSFGHPNRSGDQREVDEPFSISISLFDEKPLNINLTGALIENVMGYLDHAKRAGSKSAVPHLIRNDTGMVRMDQGGLF
jgi:hypothetical protein